MSETPRPKLPLRFHVYGLLTLLLSLLTLCGLCFIALISVWLFSKPLPMDSLVKNHTLLITASLVLLIPLLLCFFLWLRNALSASYDLLPLEEALLLQTQSGFFARLVRRYPTLWTLWFNQPDLAWYKNPMTVWHSLFVLWLFVAKDSGKIAASLSSGDATLKDANIYALAIALYLLLSLLLTAGTLWLRNKLSQQIVSFQATGQKMLRSTPPPHPTQQTPVVDSKTRQPQSQDPVLWRRPR